MPVNVDNLSKNLSENQDGQKKEDTTSKKVEQARQSKVSAKDILDICKENNRLLRKMVRHQRWASFFSFLKLLIIIVPLVAAYIYLPPLIDQAMRQYRSTLNTVEGIKSNLDTVQEIGGTGILDQFKDISDLLR